MVRKAVVLAALALGAAAVQAMDPRCKDANGDLVADAPTDPKEWVDPSVLVFS